MNRLAELPSQLLANVLVALLFNADRKRARRRTA